MSEARGAMAPRASCLATEPTVRAPWALGGTDPNMGTRAPVPRAVGGAHPAGSRALRERELAGEVEEVAVVGPHLGEGVAGELLDHGAGDEGDDLDVIDMEVRSERRTVQEI